MIEIPPRFAGRPPVNPDAQAEFARGARWNGKGAQGLAEDVRYYGRWMRDEAEKRIGHLYPKIEVTGAMAADRPDLKRYAGRKLTVIAWLWARTVKSPNPAFAQVDVPLASTFMLSTKKGKEAWVEPVLEDGGYRFTVKTGAPEAEDPDAGVPGNGVSPRDTGIPPAQASSPTVVIPPSEPGAGSEQAGIHPSRDGMSREETGTPPPSSSFPRKRESMRSGNGVSREGTGVPPAQGTKLGRGANFRCLMSDAPIPGDYIKAEGKTGRMGARLMAIVAEGDRGRVYLAPTPEHEAAARKAAPEWKPDVEFFQQALGFRIGNYGMTKWSDLFTPRQLVALTTFSDLVQEASARIEHDVLGTACPGRTRASRPLKEHAGGTPAPLDDDTPLVESGSGVRAYAEAGALGTRAASSPGHDAGGTPVPRRDAPFPEDEPALRDGGTGVTAYAEAIALYLAFAVSKTSNRASTMCTFKMSVECPGDTFGRQAVPMSWDYAEANTLSGPSGSFGSMVKNVVAGLLSNGASRDSFGAASQADAASQTVGSNKIISTDPPYYDNIGYADLSDFFYVWLRRSLKPVFPELLVTLAVPKTEELVATPYRHGSRDEAETFFLDGMTSAIRRFSEQTHPVYPVTIYYAFKQSETKAAAGTASTGWETFLDAVIRSGFAITGTWPVRTERENRKRNQGSNALASSIVLVCRRRPPDTPATSRRDFLAALRSELPPALAELQKSNIAPVDFAQAAIGPGMAIFTRSARVLEADGSPMSVRSALVEINRTLDETLARQEGDLDPDTRFCVAWYEQYGAGERPYGEAEVLFSAKNTSFEGLQRAGVVVGGKGKVRLRRRDELDPDWNPATDRRITDWEGAQHLTRSLTAERGGGVAEAARLVLGMGAERADKARALAYRLYSLAERKRWTDEAHAYNILVTSWPQIRTEAARLAAGVPEQAGFDLPGGATP